MVHIRYSHCTNLTLSLYSSHTSHHSLQTLSSYSPYILMHSRHSHDTHPKLSLYKSDTFTAFFWHSPSYSLDCLILFSLCSHTHHTHRKKTNPRLCVKLWKHVCLPSLLFGSELWIIGQSQWTALERCQRWFLQKVFHLPKFTNGPVLMKVSGLRSIEAEIHYRKLLFFC